MHFLNDSHRRWHCIMEGLFREKSWSVKLVEGFISENQVRAELCTGCEGTCDLIVRHRGNPNLVLFGCERSKCQHRLIRLQFRAAE
jgi:hypothetical protein